MQFHSQTTFLRIFLRSYLVGAAYNMRGLQNVGFIYALDPGLALIHKDPEQLSEARGRYIRHHNCHPFWAPLLVGVFLRSETDIAQGKLPAATFTALKDTATNTLSALGDSVFGGTMLVTWALTCALLIALDQPGAAMATTVVLFLGLQFFKLCTFAAGLRYGLAVLLWLRRWDMINWGDRLKMVNALLLALFLVHAAPQDLPRPLWGLIVGPFCVAAWLSGRFHVSRMLVALTVLGLIIAFLP